MKTFKGLIDTIRNNTYYQSLAKMSRLNIESFYNQKLDKKIVTDRLREYNYTATRYEYLVKQFKKHIPSFEMSFKLFEQTYLIDLKIYAYVRINPYKRIFTLTQEDIEYSIYIQYYCPVKNRTIHHNITPYHSVQFNQKSILDIVLNYLSKTYYPYSSVLGEIQRKYSCSKKDVKLWYKEYKKSNAPEPIYDSEKRRIIKSIEKRYNYKSEVNLANTISVINKLGHQNELKHIINFNLDKIDLTEDIDTIERQFMEQCFDKNVICI